MHPEVQIEYMPVEQLIPYIGNARTHSGKQVAQLAKCIKRFRYIAPVLIDKNGLLIAGHGRLLAAKHLGLTHIPAIRIEHLTEAERRALTLADNKITTNAGWDSNLLRVELEFLMNTDFDFDADAIGFETPELNLLINPSQDPTIEEPIPEPPQAADLVSQTGDIWTLGAHRVACGDCRDSALREMLLKGEQARMVCIDPPYNVPIAGHVCGNGKHQHNEFKMAAGEMSRAQFIEFLKSSLDALADGCMDGALLFCCIDWRHYSDLYQACTELGLSPVNMAVWVKSNGGMGSLYRSQHELILIIKKGTAPHINNVELGKHGRYRSNVWRYAGMNAFGAERDEALSVHPTVKPTAMIMDAIQDVTHHGDIVMDSFLGSGTTLIAAQKCQRRCFGIEIEPRYVDVILQRWMDLTGDQPVHAASGLSFNEIRASRLSEKAA